MGSDAGKLERHPSLDDRFDPAVRIVDHDPAWAARAREELNRLGDALGADAVRLEHVGSTAVPGLAAKPILDLQLSVAAIEPRDRYVAALERLGYLFVTDPESPDFHFFARPPALKREAVRRAPRDRLAYIEAKQEYLTHLEAHAVGWAHERRLAAHADRAADQR